MAGRLEFIKQYKNINKVNLLIFMVMFGALGSYFAYTTDAVRAPAKDTPKTEERSSLEQIITSTTKASPNPTKRTLSSPNFNVSPASKKVAPGAIFSIALWADTNGQNVNAVQANLSYPRDKLEFINVDNAGSAFGINAQALDEGGKVFIGKGNFEPLSGKLLIATVNFKAIANRVRAQVNFTSDSVLADSTNNTNILIATYGGTYNLSR